MIKIEKNKLVNINKKRKGSNRLIKEIIKNKYVYILLLPGLVWLAIFAYGPMYGLQLAFKNFMFNKGIVGSPWVGFENFNILFKDPLFWRGFRNTLIISFGRIIFTFPFPIVLAILINELREGRYKKLLQTVYTFPHFLSWVTVSGIILTLVSSEGVINKFLNSIGMDNIPFMAKPELFRPIIYVSAIWKSAGWSSIIYLAAISGIDPIIYEAATVDGANRWHKVRYITWPELQTTVVILLILQVGGSMNAGFDQIFNLYNPVVYEMADIIDTYIYRITFQQGSANYGFTTSLGLFKSVCNFFLIIIANKAAKLIGNQGLY